MPAPERFALAKPRFGRARGGVQVAGALVIEHPMLLQAVVVPFEQIAGFSAGADLEPTETDLVLARDLRVLPITGRPGTPSGVVVVLHTPAEVGPFKRGARQVLPISTEERRHGAEVSVLELGVDDEAGLAAALVAAGVRRAPLTVLLRDVGGEAVGPEREARIEAAIAAHRRMVRAITFGAVLGTLAIAARVVALLADDIDWSAGFVVQLAVASLLCMLLSAAWLLRPGRPAPIGAPEPPAPRGRRRWIPVVVAAIAAFVALGVAGADLPRPAVVGLGALAAGGLGGLVLVQVPALGGPLLPGVVVRPPQPRRQRWLAPVGALVLLVAIVGVVLLVAPSGADRLAQRAAVTADQLPAGWSERYSQPFTGDLDAHICGADDAALPAHDGGHARGFERKQDAQGIGPVWIDLTILLAPEEATAALEFAAVDSVGYESCLLERVEQMTEDYVSDDAGPARSFRLARSTPEVGGPIVVDHTVSEYLSDDGSIHRQHIAFVRMQVGRAIVRMPFSSFRGPVSDAEIAQIAEVVHDRVALVMDGSP